MDSKTTVIGNLNDHLHLRFMTRALSGITQALHGRCDHKLAIYIGYRYEILVSVYALEALY